MKRCILLLAVTLFAAPVMAAEVASDAVPPVTAKEKTPEVIDYFKDPMHKMHENMAPPSGNIDVDYAKDMIAHHQGAIDMAKIHLKYSKDKELRALSEKIIKAQEPEIRQMQNWLDKHEAKKPD